MNVPTQPSVGIAALRKRAFSLGSASAFDYAMQFLLPMVLVRCLTPESFGQYRLLWLAVVTLTVAVQMQMPQTLYFFLPRSDAATKRLYVHQTMLYLGTACLLGGLALSPWNPLLPDSLRSLDEYAWLLPPIATLLGLTYLLDILPTIEERVDLQARFTMAMSLLRTLSLGGAAWLTGDVHVVIALLLALLAVKFLVLLAYVGRMHGLRGAWFERRGFVGQFSHAAPFGIASALHGLRAQADQWVAASLFALGNFAAFSVGAVLQPMVSLVRQSVNFVFMPSMSRLQAAGDLAGMVEINNRANVMVATLVYPMLAFAFVFAEEIVTLVYTHAYVAAAPVMRVYVASLALYVVEVSSIMLLMREGSFAARLNLVVLVASVALSWFAAQRFGLAGAAVGSTLALYAERYGTLRRIKTATGIPLTRLQDWPALARLMLFAALAGTSAWVVVGDYVAATAVLPRLFVGGTIVTVVYGALWLLASMALRRPPLASAAARSGRGSP
jgi:O-antigen/teichoic acid export membrane protein